MRLQLLFLVLTVAACTQHQPSLPPSYESIFSNRPMQEGEDLYVVTLESPALLKVASGGKIPAGALEQIVREQAQLEQELKTLAPQAAVIFRYRMILNAEAIFTTSAVIEKLTRTMGARAYHARVLG